MRLVRRLLPALVVVLAAAAVLTIIVQPETRWKRSRPEPRQPRLLPELGVGKHASRKTSTRNAM